ncbi:MAG: hypothetical protein QM777_01565 [Pseudorhodoferax sp.]
MAVPHSGMLGQAPEDWLKNAERDFDNPELWFRNRTWTYPELEAHRGKAFEQYLTIEERTARAARCRAALDEMAAAYKRAKVDVAIILGKDQKEIFTALLAVDRDLHRRRGAQRPAAARGLRARPPCGAPVPSEAGGLPDGDLPGPGLRPDGPVRVARERCGWRSR